MTKRFSTKWAEKRKADRSEFQAVELFLFSIKQLLRAVGFFPPSLHLWVFAQKVIEIATKVEDRL